MNTPETTSPSDETMRQYALRWAILVSWFEELGRKGCQFEPTFRAKIEEARVKICSGAFNTCTTGFVLGEIEASLTSQDASLDEPTAGFWVGLLGQAMEDPDRMRQALCIPEIHSHFLDCAGGSCDLGGAVVD